MTIHFVYSVFAGEFVEKARRRVMRFAHRHGIDGGWLASRNDINMARWPFRAPESITKHVYQALRSRFDTRLYDLRERLVIKGGPSDVLIGHPLPGDDRAVWNSSFRNGKFGARIGMWPLHHALADINSPLDQFVPEMDRIFAITGPYWFDTWEQSALADWKSKMVRLDMAIDTRWFPRIKLRFNPPGKRKFFYIGNVGPCKGAHLLSLLFERAKPQRCLWVGGEANRMRNMDARPGGRLTPAVIGPIASECDFFITMGVSDANPTTILEAMAWGFPVCCTPQSGYYNMPEVIALSTTDMQHNLNVLDWLQGVSEEWLVEHANRARRTVEQRYTWESFTSTVVSELEDVLVGKGLCRAKGNVHRGVAP